MDRNAFDRWMEAYGRAWLSNDPQGVAALFTEDAVYAVSPFLEPRRGRDRIVAEWTSDPEGQTEIEFRHEVLAFEGERGVAWFGASFTRRGDGVRVEMDGVIDCAFDDDGRCREHREWYFKRELPLSSPG